MGQQVSHGELGVSRRLSNAHRHHGAVPAHHHSVEGQGNGGPLILLDPPIIVGFAVGHLLLLIQRILLQVQARGIDVGRPDHRPLVQALLADHRQQEGLAPVVPVHLVPGPEFLPPDQGAEPGGFRQADGIVHALPLGLALIQKGLIAGAIGLDVLLLPRGQTVITVGGREEEVFFPLLEQRRFFFLVHYLLSSNICWKSARARWAKVSTVSVSVLSKVSSQCAWNQALGFWAATRIRA